MHVDQEQIRELADLAHEKGLAEITVVEGERSVTIKLPVAGAAPAAVAAQAPMVTAAATSVPAGPAGLTPGQQEVTAPMVGTFYMSPSPGAPAFVKVGDRVAQGQVLCIIEAMKMMNELESDVAGQVVAILGHDAQAVEFGQPLFIIDTSV
ncbi:MAG: acetyl-CoA carboxylase biotin carboxyl carrier protein [Candidatus Melainabacteria bacterium]